eukprot:Gb_04618 [translate_table: standard]
MSRQAEELLLESKTPIDTQPTTNLATSMRNDFLKPILEGLRKLMLDDREEQPLQCLSEEDLTGDKGDTTSKDFEHDKILKHPRTPFNMHKNPLYTKTFAMDSQEKLTAVRGHPEGSKPQQPFGVNSSYLNAGNSIGSPTPGANPNPFNIFNGGSTSQMPTSPPFNPFSTCDPTSGIGQTNLFRSQQAPANQKTSSNSSGQTNQFGSLPMENPTTGGGYNLMSFSMPQYEIFRFNPRMPNFSYGWNGGFRYSPYPILGNQPNNMMQYSMPRNAFGFEGPFATPFPNNRTPCMPNSNNNYGGVDNTNNNSNNGNNSNGGNGSHNSVHN